MLALCSDCSLRHLAGMRAVAQLPQLAHLSLKRCQTDPVWSATITPMFDCIFAWRVCVFEHPCSVLTGLQQEMQSLSMLVPLASTLTYLDLFCVRTSEYGGFGHINHREVPTAVTQLSRYDSLACKIDLRVVGVPIPSCMTLKYDKHALVLRSCCTWTFVHLVYCAL
jgi:hypothetical protein